MSHHNSPKSTNEIFNINVTEGKMIVFYNKEASTLLSLICSLEVQRKMLKFRFAFNHVNTMIAVCHANTCAPQSYI